jgi:voltage-gated potassium channel
MAMRSSANRRRARKLTLFGLSLTLVVLVGLSVGNGPNLLFFSIVLSAVLATVVLRRLFPGSPLFSLTFANLIAVYASIFAFFIEEIFGSITSAVSGLGFSIPILFFLGGCWLRRAEVRAVVDRADIRDSRGLPGALLWLVPVLSVGLAVIVLSWFIEAAVNTDLAFLSAMILIGLIVLAVSQDVALFLVEVGLLFDEFFLRMSRLMIPAFAFLTFYALLVIVFASTYSIMSHYSVEPHFLVAGVRRAISFPESIYFSIVTLSTVGYGDIIPATNLARALASLEVVCGVMLLLFGVSELLGYTREHRRERADKDHEKP